MDGMGKVLIRWEDEYTMQDINDLGRQVGLVNVISALYAFL